MIKYYGLMNNGSEFEYSLYADDMLEADKRFVSIAEKNDWKYLGIVRWK